jgi:hypothetical protein
MPLVQHDDMIEELSADTAHHALDVRILPRTSWGDEHFLNAHVPHPLPEGVTVDTIAVAQEIPRRFVPWERVYDLLGRPRCRRMFHHVAVHDLSPFMREDHQNKEDLVRRGRHHKEIHGHQVFDVVLQERLPCRRGRFPWPHPILLHRRLGHLNA